MKKATKVFVGMSGGVDSSVAALRLKKQGYDVTGVFIKVWQPDFLACNWEKERLDAMRVAAYLDIPFLTCDAQKQYYDEVANYFVSEYKAGRTPNPDVMCNKYVKFGAFLDFAKAHRADFIATGHYARRKEKNGLPALYRGVDQEKDQSYFLWSLTQEQLKYTLLPIGDTSKNAVREEAEIAGLPTAQKKDSQGVCFLGHIDVRDFISHFVDLEPGQVLDESGRVVGKHQGAIVYTLGQRHGFTVNSRDSHRQVYYIKEKDISNNTLTVTTSPVKMDSSKHLDLAYSVWREDVREGDKLSAQTRYRQTPFGVVVEKVDLNKKELTLLPQETTDMAVKGQSCVLYQDDRCVGGGIIV